MIKILDRYIIKKFLGTFFFVIGIFVIIAMVFDVSENIDDLLKSEASAWQIFTKYYINFCFYFGNLLSPFIIFLTIIWITSKLAQRTEVIAILSGGISYARFVRPYFIASTFLVIASLFLSHYVVPLANRTKYDFEVRYLKGALTVAESNMHREIEQGTIAYFYKVNPATNSGSNFSVEKWENKQLRWKLISSGATFHPDDSSWTINNAMIRTFHADSTESVVFKSKMDTVFQNLTMEEFALRSEIVSAMNWSELNSFIEDQKLSGSGNASKFELEKYNRTATPFSIFVLTLLGVSIASRKSRGGTGLHILMAVIVGFVYIFISRMTAVSAMNLGLPAYIAVWVPSVLFAFVGWYIYSKAQK